MSEKIKASHRERGAHVYIRQSTEYQVRHHRESTRRQYELVQNARKSGFSDVVVIDEDLGRSGSGYEERPGFQRLAADVCEGKVGAVFAIEASRLARNNGDWYNLINLCALTETLVIDHDGVYDPRQRNDRLLLGLKATFSEYEVGIFRQRAQEALDEKIARGEVLTEVPVGFVRTKDNRIEMTPDRQVQEAIHGIFAKFRELGSARQVLLWYQQNRIPVPAGELGSGGKEVIWKPASNSRILHILKNPSYAGAFAYGRTCTKTVMENGRPRKVHGFRRPRDEWKVLILSHHEGYISWEEHWRIREQLEANAAMKNRMRPGPAKSGPALLSGLLRCARCGRKLCVSYCGTAGREIRYRCGGGNISQGTPLCISFGSPRVDKAVANKVLESIEPAAIDAALKAQEDGVQEEDERRRALTLALEKADYEVKRASRQYDAVDPENRLVASELERRWNEKLQERSGLERRIEELAACQETLGEEERDRLFDLAGDLAQLWNHPEASQRLKKRILHTVIEEIVVDVTEEPAEVSLRIHWKGGVHNCLRVPKNRTGRHSRCTDRKVVDLVEDLAKVCDDACIARTLNCLGYRTGAKNTWTESRVRSLRSYKKIPAFDRSADRPWVTMSEAARELGVSSPVIRRLLNLGVLPGRQIVKHAPWVIERKDLELSAVRQAIEVTKEGRRVSRSVPGQAEFPFNTRT